MDTFGTYVHFWVYTWAWTDPEQRQEVGEGGEGGMQPHLLRMYDACSVSSLSSLSCQRSAYHSSTSIGSFLSSPADLCWLCPEPLLLMIAECRSWVLPPFISFLSPWAGEKRGWEADTPTPWALEQYKSRAGANQVVSSESSRHLRNPGLSCTDMLVILESSLHMLCAAKRGMQLCPWNPHPPSHPKSAPAPKELKQILHRLHLQGALLVTSRIISVHWKNTMSPKVEI